MAFGAELRAEAAPLAFANRCSGDIGDPRSLIHHSTLDPLGDAACPGKVCRPHPGPEPVAGAVGYPYRVTHGVVRDHLQHRIEDILPRGTPRGTPRRPRRSAAV